MCGIAVYLTLNFKSREEVFIIILEALEILQNRGYDSMGIGLGTTISMDPFLIFRTVSSPQQSALEKMKQVLPHRDLQHPQQYCPWGLGHTRWATHGSRILPNTHPHCFISYTGWCISLVHNGIIENYADLMDEYYPAKSETDTEHIVLRLAQLLDGMMNPSTGVYGARVPELLERTKGLSPNEQVYVTFKYLVECELKGTWAIACHISHPRYQKTSSFYISKNGSPLLLGYNEQNELFVTSEQSAFQKYNPHWLSLPDMCTIQIDRKQRVRTDKDTWLDITEYVPQSTSTSTPTPTPTMSIPTTPAPYTYWTEKEIVEQSKTLWEVLNRGGRIHEDIVKLGGLDMHQRDLLSLDHLVLTGCGTSFYACLWGLRMLKQWTGMKTVQAIDASELDFVDLPQQDGKIGLVVVSQSGETRDCIRVLDELQHHVYMTIGIVNVVGSLITTKTDCGIYLNAGREWGVASTKSFTSQTIALVLMGMWFAQHRSISVKTPLITHKLALMPQQFKHHIQPIRQEIQSLVPTLQDHTSMFILGRAWAYPIALEGALKIKELAYVHVEGFPGGGLKHGPFALIDQGTPIFIIMFNGPHFTRMISACQETALRGAHVIAITNEKEETKKLVEKGIIKDLIHIEENDEWTASLISVLVFQWLAVELAIAKKQNPDFPRHLAKVVTVDG